MSRGEASKAFKTSQGEESTNASEAAGAFGGATSAIKDYQEALSNFMSADPYKKGGEYDRTINAALGDTAQGGADSVRGEIQNQAERTGENASAGNATAASAAEQATRDLASEKAKAEEGRIGSEATYGEAGVKLSAEPISAEEQLYGTSTGAATGATGNMIGAAKADQSFWDTLGDSFAQGLGSTSGKSLGFGGGGFGG